MTNQHLNKLKTMNIEQLSDLSDEIADFLAAKTSYDVDSVIKSINIVETTLALHVVFNPAEDRILFDDPSSIMVHKVLTGRTDELRLRSAKELALDPDNPYDTYSSGEIGESLGFALAQASQTNKHVICILDDYALNYGVTYETLVQINREQPNLIIIMIDEQQSLLRHYNSLDSIIKSIRISKTYTGLKKDMRMMLDSNPLSRPLFNTLVKMRDAVKENVLEPTIFKQFGINYQGPIDGTSLGDLIKVFELAKEVSGPQIIHVQTRLRKKPKRNLQFPAFKTDSSVPKDYITYHEAFDDTLVNIKNVPIMLLVDTLYFGDYFAKFEQEFPNNYKVTTGSPEALITMASGYQSLGYHVVVAMSSQDILDALNPLRHQFMNQHKPITILLRNSGLINTFNPIKQGIYDVDGLYKGMNVHNPRNSNEAKLILNQSILEGGLNVIRYQNLSEDPQSNDIETSSEWRILNPTTDYKAILFTTGVSSSHVATRVASENLPIAVVHARNISMVDDEVLSKILEKDVPWYVYNIDSKLDTITMMLKGYLFDRKKHRNIKSFNLENLTIRLNAGDFKRLNKLNTDDILRSILADLQDL